MQSIEHNESEPPVEASQLLDLIAGNTLVSFQTFGEPDHKTGLAKILHGSLRQHHAELARLNDRGAGVFFMVNRGTGKGRAVADVTQVRAVFVDLDGAPLQPVLDGPLRPHATVESSPGKFHAYWAVEGVPLGDFRWIQHELAAKFGGDKVVKDLARVMRLPGFLHRKGTPFRTRILEIEQRPRYTLTEIVEGFALTRSANEPQKPALSVAAKDDRIPEGVRNDRLFQSARAFINNGLDLDGVMDRVQKINATRCDPPLCATEVDAIVRNAAGVPPKGGFSIPYAVFDSDAYRGLSHGARTVLVAAYRRRTVSGVANISLPFRDFSKEFRRAGTFYRARKEAVEAGFIRLVRDAKWTSSGVKEPDLFQVVQGRSASTDHGRSA